MALLNVTKKGRNSKRAALLLAGALTLSVLSGCSTGADTSGVVADMLKPDVNRRQKLMTDPNLVVSTFPEALNDPYADYADNTQHVGGGTPTGPSGPTGSIPDPSGSEEVGGNHHTPTVFVTQPVVNSLVPHDTYVEYLRNKVLAPLDSAIGNNPNLYYRVFTMGMNYNEYTVTTTFPAGEYTESRLTQGVTADYGNYRNFAGARNIDGLILNNFIMRYFGQVGSNSTLVSEAVEKAKTQLMANGVLDTWTTDNVPEDSSFRKTALFKMWKSMGAGVTASQFSNSLSTGSLKDGTLSTLPNMTLSYYTAKNSYGGRNTLNAVNSRDEDYTKTLSVYNAGTAFAHANQFPTRGTTYDLNVNQSSDNEMLRAYVDGYNVTIIYVGLVHSDAGPTSIRDALDWDAVAYNAVYNAVQGAATPNQLTAVQAEGYSFTPIPTGVREGA